VAAKYLGNSFRTSDTLGLIILWQIVLREMNFLGNVMRVIVIKRSLIKANDFREQALIFTTQTN
jgi:hypothetical protein